MREKKPELVKQLAAKERKEHPWITVGQSLRLAGDHVRLGKRE